MKYKLVCFDFDHTLTAGLSAAEHVAVFLKCEEDMSKAETQFQSGKLTTREFTDRFAGNFRGYDQDEVATHMLDIPLISDIAETVKWLKSLGVRVVINTVGFRAIISPVGSSLGFQAISGAVLSSADGKFDGRVKSYFPLQQKVAFAERQAGLVDANLSQVIAVGDGLSDLHLFENVGFSVAFNAPPGVNAQARAKASGTSCLAIRQVLEPILN